MFSSARQVSLQSQHRLYTPPSPPTPARRRAIIGLRAVLIVTVTMLSVFTAGRILFAGAPLGGGVADLFTLYGATVGLAIALAGLFELKAPAEESNDGNDRTDRHGSNRISGVFRRTRDESFRLLAKAMRIAHAG